MSQDEDAQLKQISRQLRKASLDLRTNVQTHDDLINFKQKHALLLEFLDEIEKIKNS